MTDILSKIKREYARERGFMGLLQMEDYGMIGARDVDEIAKRYAKEVAMQALENASSHFDEKTSLGQISINVITSESNIPEI